jgi:hypothetical protein
MSTDQIIAEILDLSGDLNKKSENFKKSFKVNNIQVDFISNTKGTYLNLNDVDLSTEDLDHDNGPKHKYLTLYIKRIDPKGLAGEVADLARRDHYGFQAFEHNNIYKVLKGNDIKTDFNCLDYEEVAHFILDLKNWGFDDLALAYRMLYQSVHEKFTILETDLEFVFSFLSVTDYEIDTIKYKIEEKLLKIA